MIYGLNYFRCGFDFFLPLSQNKSLPIESFDQAATRKKQNNSEQRIMPNKPNDNEMRFSDISNKCVARTMVCWGIYLIATIIMTKTKYLLGDCCAIILWPTYNASPSARMPFTISYTFSFVWSAFAFCYFKLFRFFQLQLLAFYLDDCRTISLM